MPGSLSPASLALLYSRCALLDVMPYLWCRLGQAELVSHLITLIQSLGIFAGGMYITWG